MGQLQSTSFDSKTRVGGEFYLYYNLGQALNFGTISMGSDGSTVSLRSNAGCQTLTPAASGVYVVRARNAISGVGNISVSGLGISGTLIGPCPPGAAVEGSGTYNASTLTGGCGGAAAGDQFDVMFLPAPASDVLVCYDEGVSVEQGNMYKAIGRKFNPIDHWVRQRQMNQITLKELLVANEVGLSQIAQRDCCLIGKFFPDGGAVPSEIYYWTRCRLTKNDSIPEDVNESATVSLTGQFADFLCFYPGA